MEFEEEGRERRGVNPGVVRPGRAFESAFDPKQTWLRSRNRLWGCKSLASPNVCWLSCELEPA